MDQLFHIIYISNLSTILVTMLVLLMAWSVFGALFYSRMRVISSIVTIISILVVVYITVFSRSESLAGYELIPFSSFQRAIENPEMYRSMLMNVFLFYPLGLALPFIFKGSTAKRILLAIAVGFTLSVMAEALQGLLSLGMLETDDVICNTLGTVIGSCGYLLSLLWIKLYNKRKKGEKPRE